MKKFALVLLIALLCLPVLAFAACADPADDPYDLSTKEIGYEIPVYPDCEFSYVVKWTERDPETREEIEKSCTVKITDMKATLTAKNTISDGQTLDDNFYPYTIQIKAIGNTDPSFAGLEIYFYIACDFSAPYETSTVDQNGSIVWEYSFGTEKYAHELSFRRLHTNGVYL